MCVCGWGGGGGGGLVEKSSMVHLGTLDILNNGLVMALAGMAQLMDNMAENCPCSLTKEGCQEEGVFRENSILWCDSTFCSQLSLQGLAAPVKVNLGSPIL